MRVLGYSVRFLKWLPLPIKCIGLLYLAFAYSGKSNRTIIDLGVVFLVTAFYLWLVLSREAEVTKSQH